MSNGGLVKEKTASRDQTVIWKTTRTISLWLLLFIFLLLWKIDLPYLSLSLSFSFCFQYVAPKAKTHRFTTGTRGTKRKNLIFFPQFFNNLIKNKFTFTNWKFKKILVWLMFVGISIDNNNNNKDFLLHFCDLY